MSLTTRRNGRPSGRYSHVLLASDNCLRSHQHTSRRPRSSHAITSRGDRIQPRYHHARGGSHSVCRPASPAPAILTTVLPPEQPSSDPQKTAPDRANITLDPYQPNELRSERQRGHGRACIGAAVVNRPPAAAAHNPSQPRPDLRPGSDLSSVSAYTMYSIRTPIGHSCI